MPTDSETNSRGRRQRRVPGCTKTIKSQGVCQKHGAKTKMCKVHNCTKGSQGGCEGMCKAHYKESKNQGAGGNVSSDSGNVGSNGSNGSSIGSNGGGAVDEPPAVPSVYEKVLPETICHKKGATSTSICPLVAHLSNYKKCFGWHRNEKRIARGLQPVAKQQTNFEPWECQLVMYEVLLLYGVSGANFRYLAHAWGRDVGFHEDVVNQVLGRRGDTERKKRSDAGSRKAK